MDKLSSIERVHLAQKFFRFAYQIGTPISFGLAVEYSPSGLFVFGEHNLSVEDIGVDPRDFALCGTILDRLAYRLLAMELDSKLIQAFADEDRLNHSDPFIRDPKHCYSGYPKCSGPQCVQPSAED